MLQVVYIKTLLLLP